MKEHLWSCERISRPPCRRKGKPKAGAQATALRVPMNRAAGAETGWSRQGFRQEAALGECELIPLLNPYLNGHRLEGTLKEAKRQALCCLIPMALDFQRNLRMRKDFYCTEAMRFQQSPFLMPSFHLPDPFLPIAESHVFPEAKASIKKKPV